MGEKPTTKGKGLLWADLKRIACSRITTLGNGSDPVILRRRQKPNRLNEVSLQEVFPDRSKRRNMANMRSPKKFSG